MGGQEVLAGRFRKVLSDTLIVSRGSQLLKEGGTVLGRLLACVLGKKQNYHRGSYAPHQMNILVAMTEALVSHPVHGVELWK